ncbi:poly(A) RNA polymerase gld-2 homolog B isoform X2 [Orussus abietinus]|uniref:poly(A) RNA polymerase gld-2 homolog B isoform X2 n=1 Tax=Orussus abietinus TaxID=222816 RepID=UPI000C716092|nr:poly(A) RNA polymerase gld-2 homolog B isoform X2 [Orussus abietinus]
MMYQTVFSPHMLMQVMDGQQINGQCLQLQNHSIHMNGANPLYQNEYIHCTLDGSLGPNRHRTMQMASYPLELLQAMGVEIPPLRHTGYNMQNGIISDGGWQRRGSPLNNNPSMPPPRLNFRQVNPGPIKKPHWNSKSSKRSSHRDSVSESETCGNDSRPSSCSSTPTKHTDGSQSENSDDRDSVTSLAEQTIKLPDVRPLSNCLNNSAVQGGLISNTLAPQFYQNQRPVNYYHSSVPTPRSQPQTYQNKKRYHCGRTSPPMQRIQRGKKYSGVVLPTSNVFTRFYIAPDRFLARSHLIEVTKIPENLITGSIWDDLSKSIWQKFMASQQTETTYRNKMMLWKHLYIYIKSNFPKYGLFLVGSTMNGFGSDNSDVDMCLLVRQAEMDQRNEAVIHLDQVLKCLKSCEYVDQLELIQAKVPILKFRDSIQNLEVDLNCNNAVGIRNTHLLYCYSQIDWRVRPLVLIVKLWAQSQDINDAKNMTISSYSLVLMVIHFLQWRQSSGPALPAFPFRGQIRSPHGHPLHRHPRRPRRLGHSAVPGKPPAPRRTAGRLLQVLREFRFQSVRHFGEGGEQGAHRGLPESPLLQERSPPVEVPLRGSTLGVPPGRLREDQGGVRQDVPQAEGNPRPGRHFRQGRNVEARRRAAATLATPRWTRLC